MRLWLRLPARGGGRPLRHVGFVCDHIEVLDDLDVAADAVCREIRLPVVRAKAVNDHPGFIGAVADRVIRTVGRYKGGRPLSFAANAP